jgi:hypothetical protein
VAQENHVWDLIVGGGPPAGVDRLLPIGDDLHLDEEGVPDHTHLLIRAAVVDVLHEGRVAVSVVRAADHHLHFGYVSRMHMLQYIPKVSVVTLETNLTLTYFLCLAKKGRPDRDYRDHYDRPPPYRGDRYPGGPPPHRYMDDPPYRDDGWGGMHVPPPGTKIFLLF